jgi:hypothetical protein
MSASKASGSIRSVRKRVMRLINGELTSKKGFSVVAPIRMTVPSSTPGSSASCWDFEKRWISSRKSTVRRSSDPSLSLAADKIALTSLTPAFVAERVSKAAST